MGATLLAGYALATAGLATCPPAWADPMPDLPLDAVPVVTPGEAPGAGVPSGPGSAGAQTSGAEPGTTAGVATAGVSTAGQPAPTASPDPTPIVGPPAGPELTGEALATATQAISSQLRCPVCQGLSVADSPSESAQAIKREVQRLAAKGYTQEQCLLYFEASYGEFILLQPKPEGLNLLVWAAPTGLVAVGLGIVAWMRFSNRPKSDGMRVRPAPPPVPLGLRVYVARVYEAVGAPAQDATAPDPTATGARQGERP